MTFDPLLYAAALCAASAALCAIAAISVPCLSDRPSRNGSTQASDASRLAETLSASVKPVQTTRPRRRGSSAICRTRAS